MKRIILILTLLVMFMLAGCFGDSDGPPVLFEVFIDSDLDSIIYSSDIGSDGTVTVKSFPHIYKSSLYMSGYLYLYAVKDTGVVQLNFRDDGGNGHWKDTKKYLIRTPCEEQSFDLYGGYSSGPVDPL